MYRKVQKKQIVYCTQESGGVGDDIASLPAVNFILENHPHIEIVLWVKSYFKSIAQRTLKHPRLTIYTFDEKDKIQRDIPVKRFSGNPYTNLASHTTEQAFDILCNTRPDDVNFYNYLPINTTNISIKRFKLPEKYVVVPTGYTAKVREMIPEVVNGLSDYINTKGYTPVYLGRESTPETSDLSKVIKGKFSDENDYTKGINLINKTSMLEAVQILKGAKTIVGLDNGIIHLAATTDIPIVCGFTTVKPEHRAPYRHGIKGWNFYPVVPEGCRFCQSNWTFTFFHNFTKCFYDDYVCCQNLTTNLYIEQLQKVFNKIEGMDELVEETEKLELY